MSRASRPDEGFDGANWRGTMNTIKIVAVVLIVAGVLGLLYGGFSYTKETHDVKLGPIELSVKEKQTVNVPMWAGVGAIVVGGLLLVFGSKKG
jgi:TRAP-type C4-dicarboxylate transport system permease small subunit